MYLSGASVFFSYVLPRNGCGSLYVRFVARNLLKSAYSLLRNGFEHRLVRFAAKTFLPCWKNDRLRNGCFYKMLIVRDMRNKSVLRLQA